MTCEKRQNLWGDQMDTYVGKQGKSKKNSSGWKMEMQNEQRPIRKREKIQSKRFIF